MDLVYIILLSVLALVLIIGIIRIIVNPADDIGGLILELFLLDVMWDLIIAIFSAIGESLSDW